MNIWLFYVLAAATTASALGVVISPNPVRSALSLVATLFLLAVSYVCLQAHLVAALQIIVYAGAVMVLFLFVITLLNLQTDASIGTSVAAITAAVACSAVVALGLGMALFNSDAASKLADLPADFGTTAVLARNLFSQHIASFELTSILLLVAAVGAVAVAQRDPVAEPDQDQGTGQTAPPATPTAKDV